MRAARWESFKKWLTEFTIKKDDRVNDVFLGLSYKATPVVILIAILITVFSLGQHNDVELGVSNVYTNLEGVDINVKTAELFDAVDLTGPNKESDSFFITTYALATDQEIGICKDSKDGGRPCKFHHDCKNGTKTKNGLTISECDLSTKLCKIKGWCPVEDSRSNVTRNPKLQDISNITVYVKNRIAFLVLKKYEQNYNFTNIRGECRYDKKRSPLCPIFEISTLIKEMGLNYSIVSEKGATFGFSIKWDCYYNYGSGPCSIKYELKKLVTDKVPECDRCMDKYAKFDKVGNKRVRTKISALGLRFVVLVESRGYKFGFFKFLKSVGALFFIINIGMFLAYWLLLRILNKQRRKKLQESICLRHLADRSDTLEFHGNRDSVLV